MTRHTRIALKTGVWVVCLAPLAALVFWFLTDDLGPNPISFVTNTLGDWTFRILLASLAMTPLRLVLGVAWPISLRRLLGLFAFCYATFHFGVWLVLDHFFDWGEMAADIVKRPYVTAGMGALLFLAPLAATSTAGMVKRMGGVAWQRLHRLVFVSAVLAALHFIWLAKVGRIDQYVHAATLALLVSIRLWNWARRRALRDRQGRAADPALA